MFESGEMYLESIYVLSLSKTIVRAIDICEMMNYSKPSVSRGLKLLREEGYISVAKDGAITLSEEGLKKAANIYERHQVLSQILMELGVSKDVAIEDACRIEHYISDETFLKIKEHIKKFS